MDVGLETIGEIWDVPDGRDEVPAEASDGVTKVA